MKYVYLLRSISHPDQRYVGLTSGIETRLAAHNAGQSLQTAHYRPWQLVTALQFMNAEKAVAFESYLKTGSGWAFANRHLW